MSLASISSSAPLRASPENIATPIQATVSIQDTHPQEKMTTSQKTSAIFQQAGVAFTHAVQVPKEYQTQYEKTLFPRTRIKFKTAIKKRYDTCQRFLKMISRRTHDCSIRLEEIPGDKSPVVRLVANRPLKKFNLVNIYAGDLIPPKKPGEEESPFALELGPREGKDDLDDPQNSWRHWRITSKERGNESRFIQFDREHPNVERFMFFPSHAPLPVLFLIVKADQICKGTPLSIHPDIALDWSDFSKEEITLIKKSKNKKRTVEQTEKNPSKKVTINPETSSDTGSGLTTQQSFNLGKKFSTLLHQSSENAKDYEAIEESLGDFSLLDEEWRTFYLDLATALSKGDLTQEVLEKITQCANQVLKRFPEDAQAQKWLAKMKQPLLSFEVQNLEEAWDESTESKTVMAKAFRIFQKVDQATDLKEENRKELQQKLLTLIRDSAESQLNQTM